MSVGKMDRESSFVNGRGEKIYCRYWPPLLKPGHFTRGVVLILHGYTEHCALYEHVARALTTNGVAVTAHDLVGFGQSEGDRAHITDFQHYVDDVIQHVDLIEEKFPHLPFFIVGHSMGGLIGLLAAPVLKTRLRGLLLLSPLIIRSEPEPARLAMQKYDEDPLVYNKGMRAKFVVEMLRTLSEVRSRFTEITCPLMIIHGDADELCDVRGSQLLYSEASSRDKAINIYKGGLHQVHNEAGDVGQRCLTSIADWIIGRT